MTRTSYPWHMGDKPSDQNYINGRALEGLINAVDRAINRKHDFGIAELPNGEDGLKKLMVEERERKERLAKQEEADSIRLREYNDEWIKNNIPQHK